MSEIEDKILGREKKEKTPVAKKDVFATAIVWHVSKEGCGKTLFNGKTVYEMLSPEGKKKAQKGNKKIVEKGFVFERRN